MAYFRIGSLILAAVCVTSCLTPANQQRPAIRVSSEDSNSAEPAVAAFSNGDAAIVWVHHEKESADVFVRIYDANGGPKGEPVRVNPNPGEAKAWRGDPPTVKIDLNDTIYVGWTASIPNSPGTTLYVSTSRDRGGTFSPPAKVNDDTAPASHGMHSLAVDGAGHVYVAWLDERYLATRPHVEGHHHQAAEPNAELYFAASSDGGKTFSPNRMIARDICPCCKTTITASAPDGAIYIGWRQVLPGGFRHIAVVESTDHGASFAQPVIVADDQWKIDACPVSGPTLVADREGLKVVWFSGGEARPHGVYWTFISDLSPTKFSQPRLVGEADSAGTPVIIGGLAVWSDAGRLQLGPLIGRSDFHPVELGDGQVPVAVVGTEKTFVAYTKTDSGRSGVWLSTLLN